MVLAAVLVGAWPAQPEAEPVVHEFTGVVTDLLVDGALFGAPGTVQVGDGFTGRFSYEVGPTNPDQEPGDPEDGFYDLLAFEVDQSAPPLVTTLFGAIVRHEPGFATLPPAPPDPGLDGLSITSHANTYPTISLSLSGPFGSVFVDDSLPAELDLADFADGGIVRGLVSVGIGGQPNVQDLGTITSLTRAPEPAGASAAVAAAFALAGLARRRIAGGTRPGRASARQRRAPQAR